MRQRQRQRSEANCSEHLTEERSWSGNVLGTDCDTNTGMAAMQSNSRCGGLISTPYSRILLWRFSCENYRVLNERMTVKHVEESTCKETSVDSKTCGKLIHRHACGYWEKPISIRVEIWSPISPEYETLNRNLRCRAKIIIFSYTYAARHVVCLKGTSLYKHSFPNKK